MFRFSVDAFGNLRSCDVASLPSLDGSCLEVGTKSVDIGERRRVLVVVSLPSGVFGGNGQNFTRSIYSMVDESKETMGLQDKRLQTYGALISAVVAGISLLLSLCLSACITQPLKQLSQHVQRLSSLNLSELHDVEKSPITGKSFLGLRIQEIAELEDRLAGLDRGLRVFAKFVPEAIVRSIVQGDERKMRPYVDKREVTIMFSDIRDFTTIAEDLSEEELLFVLTSYLTHMTMTIEKSGGIVAEVLGDGILAFWNTPTDVPEHAKQACSAALAQHLVLEDLNLSYASENLPQLSVRIGLHTGTVLSGNIGSEFKMKFGCMGDAVNLASRLEGLCKIYGVGICLSDATKAALPGGGADFCFRRLDLVQVKGRRTPTEIFELIGRSRGASHGLLELDDAFDPSPQRLSQAQRYEHALLSFQEARYGEAVASLQSLLLSDPEDVATKRLLDRAKKAVEDDLHNPRGACRSMVSMMDEK